MNAIEQKYYDYMDQIAISVLRVIGREVGIPNASSKNKDDLIRNITAIYTGKRAPEAISKRGAPV